MNEIVLPSGTFAQLRTLRVSDLMKAECHSGTAWLAALACLAVTLDGEPVTSQSILDMPYAEAAPIFYMINAQLAESLKTQKGIA